MQFGPLALKRCRYGWMLYRGPYIGKSFELYGEYSESEVEAMRGFIGEGDVVLDVGANIGSLTLPLAHMTGPKGRVYAMEPYADNFHILCANLAMNQIANVQAINAFARPSGAPLEPRTFFDAASNERSVAIDDLALKSCRLIKVDVDGDELQVLQSAEATIARLRPILYFENDKKPKSKELLTYVFSKDYVLYWHLAPVVAPNNFFGNPDNHWEPNNLVSLMVLGIPKELKLEIAGLPLVKDADEWVVGGSN